MRKVPRSRMALQAATSIGSAFSGNVFGTVPDYLRRDHHPSQHGSTQAALDYLAASPTARSAAS